MLKRRIRNELQDDLTTTEKSIARTLQNLDRLKCDKLGFNPEVMTKKNMENLEALRAEKEKILKKIEELESEEFDDKFKKELEQNKKTIQTKTDLKLKKKNETQSITTSAFQSKKSSGKPKNSKESYVPFVSEYSMKKEEDRYLKDCAAIPDYMLNKLHNMPNNVGYIWRDIWCFGYLPVDDPDVVTMHEKSNDVYYVHVYSRRKQSYTLFRKDSQGKKIFVCSKVLNSLS